MKDRSWIVTVHKYGQDKELFRRVVFSDGGDYGMELLRLYSLGSDILKGYIRCSMHTKAYPEISGLAYRYMLEQDAGWGYVIGDYRVERRGSFEVRIKERVC